MMNSRGIQPVMKSKGFGEMAVMDLRPHSASVQAIENCAAICLSAANLYRVYARDLKQFALIQMTWAAEFAAVSGKPMSDCFAPGCLRRRRTSSIVS